MRHYFNSINQQIIPIIISTVHHFTIYNSLIFIFNPIIIVIFIHLTISLFIIYHMYL